MFLKSLNMNSSLSIAIVAANQRFFEAAILLLTSLGLPQVKVFREGEKLPDSIHTVLLFGSSNPPLEDSNLNIWMLSTGNRIVQKDVVWKVTRFDGYTLQVNYPESLQYKYAPVLNESKSRFENAFVLTNYYACKRLEKVKRELTFEEALPWYILVYISIKKELTENTSALSSIITKVKKRRNVTSRIEKTIYKCISSRKNSNILLMTLTKFILAQHYRLLSPTENIVSRQIKRITSRFYHRNKKSFIFNKNDFMRSSDLLLTLVLDRDLEFSKDVLEYLVFKYQKTVDLCYLGITSYLLGFRNISDHIFEILLSEQYFDASTGCIRSSRNATSYCYSPILLAFLMCMRTDRHESETCKDNPITFTDSLPESKVDIEWHFFASPDLGLEGESLFLQCFKSARNHLIETDDSVYSLIDFSNHRISLSLLENWLTSIRIPHLQGALELNFSNYQPYCVPFETLWFSLFRWLQNSVDIPLVALRPYPYGSKAAFSLRYDVDRKTESQQILDIIDLQLTSLNAECASWYIIPDTQYGKKVFAHLENNPLQEIGTHSLNPQLVLPGTGITFHSGPNSEYCRGLETIIKLQTQLNIKYSESLFTQSVISKPLWIEDDDLHLSARTRIWFTPLHFPLEGSTQDITLEYFDLLVEFFRQLYELGGHLIICSHPDLNQSLLLDLIVREALFKKKLWCAPVKEVVKRTQQILEYDNIRIVSQERTSDGWKLILTSRHSVADLRVDFFSPSKHTYSEKRVEVFSDCDTIITHSHIETALE